MLRQPIESAQFASGDFRQALDDSTLIVSMSRRGNRWDNAIVEIFFGTLKTALFLDEALQSREVTEAMVIDYTDGFYNPVRRHSSIGYMSPMRHELQAARPRSGGFAPAARGAAQLIGQEGPLPIA